jgi:hypothetical protein
MNVGLLFENVTRIPFGQTAEFGFFQAAVTITGTGRFARSSI